MRTSKAHDDQSEAPPQSAARREAPSAGADVPPPLTADMLRAAQRGAGNAAVAAMIARRARPAADLEQPDQQQDPGVHKVLASTGRPLPAPVRKDMEARFDTDFSDVRLHTGPAAAGSADAIGARAYTSGSHVVLGAGGGDRHTLAHELTHVVQQRSGPVAGTDQGNGLHMSDPSDRFEREAEAHAHRVMSRPAPAHPAGESARRESGGPAGSVQRMVSEEEAAPDPGTSAASTSATAATSATATTSTAAPAPPAPAPGPPQPLQEENAKRVGLEVEITVNLEEPASAAGPSSGPAAASGASRPAKNATVRNGALLAQSGERELGLPVVKLEVEGMDRSGGTPSMEVIYGPLPRAEYASQDFVRARQGLVAQFRTVAGQSVPFSQVITAYNRSLTGGATRYRLTLSTLGRRMTTLRTRAVNENMQTNISVPYAKVGAAPPPPEAASSSAAGGGRGRGGPAGRGGRGAGGGRGGATRGGLARGGAGQGPPAGRDFADLFEGSQRRMFEAARAAANTVTDARIGGRPHLVSLLTQVMFQEAMYAVHRLTRDTASDVAKQHFHVMMKTSPQDVVMAVLTDQEALDLLDWLEAAATSTEAAQKLNAGATAAAAERGGARQNVTVNVEDLKTALRKRRDTAKQQLEVRPKGATNDHSSQTFDSTNQPAGELRHFHPRASNRLPITEEGDARTPHFVVEERSAGHLLNNPATNPADKQRFLRELQER